MQAPAKLGNFGAMALKQIMHLGILMQARRGLIAPRDRHVGLGTSLAITHSVL